MTKNKPGNNQMSAMLSPVRLCARAILLLLIIAIGSGCRMLSSISGQGPQLILPIRAEGRVIPGHCLPLPLQWSETGTMPPVDGPSLALRQAYLRHWQQRLRQLKLRVSDYRAPEQIAQAVAVSAARLSAEDYRVGELLLFEALACKGLTAPEREELEYLAVLHRQAYVLFQAIVAVDGVRQGSKTVEVATQRVHEYVRLHQQHNDFLRWDDPFWYEFSLHAVPTSQPAGETGQ